MDSFQSFSSKINPFAQRLTKSFTQAKQWSQEKMGTATDVTELPKEYNDLEQRFDAIRNVQQTMLRLSKTYTSAPLSLEVNQIGESIWDFSKTVSGRIQSATMGGEESGAGAASGPSASGGPRSPTEEPVPKTVYHAMGRNSLKGSEEVGLEEPYGAALFKFGSIQEKIGDSKLQLDDDVRFKFSDPINNSLNTSIALALKARKNVYSSRLSLDATKNNLKNARPEHADQAQHEILKAEDEFVAIVEEAMSLMKAVVESPEPLRHLSELVAAQLRHYKESYELLSELAPEVDELQATQEALYRNSQNH
ncbi:BAR domain-containing protein [Tieghemiomyces parasiticus]|uniref:BAR domain-containing protein n=1 Tax=Tieghemiomyces parasiticus TaxID=78921 RepID=A0A9W8AEG7_9FUNG|nr:BAR domain-containing protein [Tieghemiomyces parasiticus]KAJ1930278.1 BAR domain-containing protein [Tieghemiomyces parasiticus]